MPQLAAAAVAQNPTLVSILSHLQRALLTGVWEVRLAAAQAIAKVAVRSGEPFRLQCYNILAAVGGGCTRACTVFVCPLVINAPAILAALQCAAPPAINVLCTYLLCCMRTSHSVHSKLNWCCCACRRR